MFGDNDNQDQNQTTTQNSTIEPASAPNPAADTSLGEDNNSSTNNPALPPADFTPPRSTDPVSSEQPEEEDDKEEETAPAASSAGDNQADKSDDLLSIKQDALQQLSPLVDHLDQTPEEKFRTTMMMIQAADDQSLIKTAYEAAKAIKDEKERAQALLDVVNEINYFTQKQS